MIGDKNNPEDSALKIAVRDAIIVGCSTCAISLIAFGYPPKPEGLYLSGLTALVTFFESLILSFRIKKPEVKT